MNSADMGNSLLEIKHAFYGLSSFFRGLLFARSNWTHAKGLRAIAEEYQRFGADIGKLIVVLSVEKDDLVLLNNSLCAINAFDRALAIDDQKSLRGLMIVHGSTIPRLKIKHPRAKIFGSEERHVSYFFFGGFVDFLIQADEIHNVPPR